jgi:AraC family transcriptional regulator
VNVSESPVPVSAGSPRSRCRAVPGCLVTHVWFPPLSVLEPHVHDGPTFAVILQGGFDLTLPGSFERTVGCPVGTVLTQPAGARHSNHIGPDGARGVVLQPDPSAGTLPADCDALLERVNHFRDGPIAAAARSLARELAAPDDMTPLAAEALVLEMLAGAAHLEQGSGMDARMPRWLMRATDMVHAHFRESLRIDEIAAEAGIHAAHLAVVFRRVHRQPLGRYMRRLRVDWAADRLLDTEATVAAIACEAGFADQAHLTRCFRQELGTTPAAYRRARCGHRRSKRHRA